MCVLNQFISEETNQHWFIWRKTSQKIQIYTRLCLLYSQTLSLFEVKPGLTILFLRINHAIRILFEYYLQNMLATDIMNNSIISNLCVDLDNTLTLWYSVTFSKFRSTSFLKFLVMQMYTRLIFKTCIKVIKFLYFVRKYANLRFIYFAPLIRKVEMVISYISTHAEEKSFSRSIYFAPHILSGNFHQLYLDSCRREEFFSITNEFSRLPEESNWELM